MVSYKLIEEERTEDAPFVGALICSPYCNLNCKNCFNQPLKDLPTKKGKPKDLIENIKTNPLNKGIILAGLEWSCNMSDLYDMIWWAKEADLKVMVYTGLNYEDWSYKFHTELNMGPAETFVLLEGVYVKSGSYREDLNIPKYVAGVKLASFNQEIYLNSVRLEEDKK